MIPIEDLDIYFHDLTYNYTQEQIEELHNVFLNDFVENPFEVMGLKVKVILKNSKVDDFEEYPETFVHLITRKSNSGKRVFDQYRANKIHWVKPILLQADHEDIKYFQYIEGDGTTRDYYWYQLGNFLVIMQKVTPEYLVITSFNIDDEISRKKFEKRYLRYLNSIK